MIAIIKQRIQQHKGKLHLMILSSLLVLVNFFTTITIVKHMGLSHELDVFYIAMTVFYFLASSVSWSLGSVLAPMLIHNRERGIEGKMFVSVALIIFSVSAIVTATMFLWGKVLFVNYLDSVPFTEILIIQGIFLLTFCVDGLTLTPFAMFQEKNRYIALGVINLISAIIGFITVYSLIEHFGIYVAAVNQLLIKTLIFIALTTVGFPTIYKTLGFDKEQFLTLWHRVKYMLFGSLYYKTDEVAERFIASYLTGGFVSLVAFIQRVYGAFITVVNAAIGVPSVTVFSNLVKAENYDLIKTTLWKYVFSLIAINSLLFIAMAVMGEALILYLLDGKIDAELLSIVHMAVLLLFAMVFGKTIGQVLQSLLLSLRKEKQVTIYDSTTFTINLIVKIAATVFYGMEGLLVAIMFSALLTDGAKLYLIYKELKKL